MRIALIVLLAMVMSAAALLSVMGGSTGYTVDQLLAEGEKKHYRVTAKLLDWWVEDGKVYLVLGGEKGRIMGVLDEGYLLARYGSAYTFESEVVLEGYYYPTNRTLKVTTILRGCHAAYSQPAATG